MLRLSAFVTLGILMGGCQQRVVEKPTGVEGHRDPEAVAVRLHNRTKVELIIAPFVREGQRGIPLTASYRLPSTEQSGPFELVPEIDLPIFAAVPADPDMIGAYSLEVLTDRFESRLAVIDISKAEMDDAKRESKLVIVFKEEGIAVMVGKKRWQQPWMRPLPKPKRPDKEFAPEQLRGSESAGS